MRGRKRERERERERGRIALCAQAPHGEFRVYRVSSLTGQSTPLGPYRRPMPRILGVSQKGGRFLMGEVPL